MDKKKAIICTILFSVIVMAIFIASVLIENKCGNTPYDIFSPFIVGAWMGGKIEAFYNWLIK